MHQECQGRGWRDGSAVKNICSSSRNTKVWLSDPTQQLTSVTPFPGVPQTLHAHGALIDICVAKAFHTHKKTQV